MFKLQIRTSLTLHGDPFLWPVFHLSGEDDGGPDANHVVRHVELQGIKAKHFHPEKADVHRWARAVE